MNNDEVLGLVNRYFKTEWLDGFPGGFEHRLDPDSSAIMYSLIREFKPTSVLEIGSWLGGSTNVMMRALLKNKNDFRFICSELDDERRLETEKNVRINAGEAPEMIGDITKNKDFIPELDFLFVDTDHDLNTTIWIVENIWPKLKKGAIFSMHDWAVEEVDGKLIGKGPNGTGGWPETNYLMDLIREDKFPFEKIHWTWQNPLVSNQSKYWETAFWRKR